MENFSYGNSYPESGDSSPHSREVDFENTPPWEELPPNYKVKFMCSYGGKIHPRPHDNQLAYIGGETKILAVERNTKFSAFVSKLSSISESEVCFKYQLPGEDLDALISVTNDDDLEHMMQEYDRMYRASPKPARLRLFLFPVNPLSSANSRSFGSDGGASDRERFVDALNSGPVQVQSSTPPSAADPPHNIDLLFGLEKGVPQPPPQLAAKLQDRIPEPEIPVDRFAADQIQRQIQDMQRLQIGAQEQELYRRRSDDSLSSGGGGGGGYGGDYYVPKFQEKIPPPPTIPSSVAPPAGYWAEKHAAPAGGVYPTSAPVPEQPVYMIQAQGGMYHPQMARPVTGPPPGQGYYAVQRMAPEVYRDQPQMYNVMQPPPPAAATMAAPPQQPQQQHQQQQQQRVGGFQEGGGYGMVRPAATGGGGVGMVEAGYALAYDNVGGRQVYYNTPGGVVQAPPYQAVSGEMRAGGVLNQEGKVIVKSSQ